MLLENGWRTGAHGGRTQRCAALANADFADVKMATGSSAKNGRSAIGYSWSRPVMIFGLGIRKAQAGSLKRSKSVGRNGVPNLGTNKICEAIQALGA